MSKNDLIIGKTYYPPKPKVLVSNNCVKGPTWEVRKEGERCFFEFLASRHGGGTDTHEITDEEFKSIQSGKMTYDDLLKKYDVV